ncbi:hypothetical protein CURTO8I2_220184 [Curtobacterium sp. 8I-2]|nr:hypothetical protein CURTO8I2_220184 [Curtobacterium sp. 8I-2]
MKQALPSFGTTKGPFPARLNNGFCVS